MTGWLIIFLSLKKYCRWFCIFKKKTPKQTIYRRGKKLSQPKTQRWSEKSIIESIRKLFRLKKENKFKAE